ncbi:hypothetical protein DID88_007487 [Monilinia fructigena]|uniref:Uncharacterized protein n=1 Tax=Monilinia fructigena TaxID=38457 RepID=A0A395J4W4_9HELO|nr:hypothetical protein DID88_007487 [Monilinia fructigena]
MENNGVNDLEAQEALAREFQPALEGPLVGEKKSSLEIAEEYAKADPIYVSKTSALPQKIFSLPTDSWRWKLWMAGGWFLLLRNFTEVGE